MSKSALLIGLMYGSLVSFGQDIRMTFTGTGASTQITTVIATNLRTNQQVSLPGGDTLVLGQTTGITGISDFIDTGFIFPNPFSGNTSLSICVQTPQTLFVRVLNLVGQVVAQNQTSIQPGEHRFDLAVSAAGIYLVSFTCLQGTSTCKIICTETINQASSIKYSGSGSNNRSNLNNRNNQNDQDNQKLLSQLNLKTLQTSHSLEYRPGDIIHYRCKSGSFTTILTDSPVFSKNYEVEFVDCTDHGRKSYAIVKVGNQIWMAENLDYAIDPYYGCYEDNPANCSTYGRLYEWESAKKACPPGWSLPKDEDWGIMERYLGLNNSESRSSGYRLSGSVGRKLKSPSGWNSKGNGDNSIGFNVLPAGRRYIVIPHMQPFPFTELGNQSFFWTSTPDTSYGAFFRALSKASDGIYRSNGPTFTAVQFSVRCIFGPGVVLATIATAEITGITKISAIGGGDLTYDGGSEISALGICWSISQNPTTADSTTDDGKGSGTFTSILTGLHQNTTYFVRAYAINGLGTSYGNQVSFKTNPGLPIITTGAILAITDTTASSGGTVISDEGAEVTARGVCWSTAPDPTLTASKTTDGTGTGSFTSNLTGLSKHKTYFVRAYATNQVGTAYGDEESFSTQELIAGEFTDLRDGNVYPWVQIGAQIWMTKNLAYLPAVSSPLIGSDTIPHFYVQRYHGTNTGEAKATITYATYGVLYNWEAAITACPDGWYLPSDSDWTTLTDYLGRLPGGKMKETGTTHWASPNEGASNASGFSALPGGDRSSSGGFYNIGISGIFWTATDTGSEGALGRDLYYNQDGIYTTGYPRSVGLSVRCVVETDNYPSLK